MSPEGCASLHICQLGSPDFECSGYGTIFHSFRLVPWRGLSSSETARFFQKSQSTEAHLDRAGPVQQCTRTKSNGCVCRRKLKQVFRMSPVDIARRGEGLQRTPIRVVLSLLLPFDPRVSLAPACQRGPGRTGLAQRGRFLRRVPDFLAESELEDASRAVILSSSLAPCKCKSDRAVKQQR